MCVLTVFTHATTGHRHHAKFNQWNLTHMRNCTPVTKQITYMACFLFMEFCHPSSWPQFCCKARYAIPFKKIVSNIRCYTTICVCIKCKKAPSSCHKHPKIQILDIGGHKLFVVTAYIKRDVRGSHNFWNCVFLLAVMAITHSSNKCLCV